VKFRYEVTLEILPGGLDPQGDEVFDALWEAPLPEGAELVGLAGATPLDGESDA
jgi:hypothetical protein